MRARVLLPVVIFVATLLGALYLQGASHTRSSVSVQHIGKNGFFVGESTKNPFIKKSYDHQAALKAIDEASEYRLRGDVFFKQDLFNEAAEEYKKAYTMDITTRAVSGLLLAMTYEKLGKYDEGIALLDQMIQNGELSEKGIQNANEIKSRLLAAKVKTGQR